MSAELQELIEKARHVHMTAEERENQRLNFAYGNARISNADITLEDVTQASRSMKDTCNEQPANR
jgi:Fic family protein